MKVVMMHCKVGEREKLSTQELRVEICVELWVLASGEYGFRCETSMLRGRLVVA